MGASPVDWAATDLYLQGLRPVVAAAVVFFCLMSVYLVYSVRGGALIQALCASAPLFYYFFVLFMLFIDIIHLFAMFIRLINIVMMINTTPDNRTTSINTASPMQHVTLLWTKIFSIQECFVHIEPLTLLSLLHISNDVMYCTCKLRSWVKA